VIAAATDFAAAQEIRMEPRKSAQEGLAMLKLSKLTAILSIMTIGAALSLGVGKALAGDNTITEDQILKALTPVKKPLTRGLSAAPVEDPAKIAKETAFVQSIRGRATRSLSNTEREEIATQIVDKPNIDLEINFDYNSAEISAKSLPSVQALGRALTNPDLKGSTFIVAGHTDAAGGDGYNQDLSERRADSIKRYLMDNYHIASTDLVTVGYGKNKLKDPNQPLAEVNRRVQVVNMENKTTASK
jgi:outer membrane protein OmpA-like peptidoglycan-associated protein